MTDHWYLLYPLKNKNILAWGICVSVSYTVLWLLLAAQHIYIIHLFAPFRSYLDLRAFAVNGNDFSDVGDGRRVNHGVKSWPCRPASSALPALFEIRAILFSPHACKPAGQDKAWTA